MSDADPLDRGTDATLFSRERGATAALTVAIWLLAVGAFAMAFTFNSRARVLPIFIVGVLVALVTVEVATQWRRRGEKLSPSAAATFGESAAPSAVAALEGSDPLGGSPAGQDEGLGEWLSIAIAMASFGTVLILGFRYGAPLFVLVFTRVYGKKSWLASSAVAIGTYLLLYQLFGSVFGVRLYPGLFG